ncbi:hypothetical protein TBLA_0H02340 [Henningerozyma blattae CBS 6284]|uniref:Probable electron transfer flavoprotein subunit beta n=1 Tax=Henningerozyma blattae (strain ATCC 34711 / CBS 6284 / DSM 70876 / NBRC 10599 / NRRL Y-10934 / UCD 77-7) TaxID=1071380 RepID=I2H817_HENB6|nr:hypothetical protein TBLA_0H02340 [Tetrapisispora blattae CBS 6284]CCH62519.1 hypothetical protein TBLA_0H02340 [Tetrapisispora blattae CBS 6284]
MLRILVPIKRVLDPQLLPRINAAKKGFEFSKNDKFSINPFDDIAVEESLLLRTKYKDLIESIQVVAIGSMENNKDILRNSIAKGVDKAILVPTKESAGDDISILNECKILEKVIEKTNSNLVLMGKQDIDKDSGIKGGILGGLLNWPLASNAAKVTPSDNGKIVVERETDNGQSTVEMSLPGIITTDLRLNVPRYVSLSKLMKAKKKPIDSLEVALSDEHTDNGKIEILQVEEAIHERKCEKVKDVDELLSKLSETISSTKAAA